MLNLLRMEFHGRSKYYTLNIANFDLVGDVSDERTVANDFIEMEKVSGNRVQKYHSLHLTSVSAQKESEVHACCREIMLTFGEFGHYS